MSTGSPASVLVVLCVLASTVSGNAQALPAAESKTRLQEINDQRIELRQEFAELLQQWKREPPRDRRGILATWQQANALELRSLKEQYEAVVRTVSQVTRPLREAQQYSFQGEQSPGLRQGLHESKTEALRIAKNLSPQNRRQVMLNWERQNAIHITRSIEGMTPIHVQRNLKDEVNQEASSPPLMPSYLPVTGKSDWDRRWILRSELQALLRQHRTSSPEVRKAAINNWQRANGMKLDVLTSEFFRPSK